MKICFWLFSLGLLISNLSLQADEIKDTMCIYMHGKLIASEDASSGETLYHHRDYLGSLRVLSDESGGIKTTFDYWPFGEDLSDAPPQSEEKYRFTGQELDISSGLYNYNARFYDPRIGRFISADLIIPDHENPQAYNRYTYVYNNPINKIDPTGNYVVEEELEPVPWVTHKWPIPPWARTPVRVVGAAISLLTPYEISVQDEHVVLTRPYGVQGATGMVLGMSTGVAKTGGFEPTPEQKLAYRLRKEQKLTAPAIAKQLGVASQTIYDWWRKMGGDPLRGQRGIDPARQAEAGALKKEILELRSQWWTYKDIGEKAGYALDTIYRFISEWGDPLKGQRGINQADQAARRQIFELMQEGYKDVDIARISQLEGLGHSGMGFTSDAISKLRRAFKEWGGPLPPLPE